MLKTSLIINCENAGDLNEIPPTSGNKLNETNKFQSSCLPLSLIIYSISKWV